MNSVDESLEFWEALDGGAGWIEILSAGRRLREGQLLAGAVGWASVLPHCPLVDTLSLACELSEGLAGSFRLIAAVSGFLVE